MDKLIAMKDFTSKVKAHLFVLFLAFASLGFFSCTSGDDSYYPDISSDGNYVYFSSEATNLVAADTNGFFDIFRAPNE